MFCGSGNSPENVIRYIEPDSHAHIIRINRLKIRRPLEIEPALLPVV